MPGISDSCATVCACGRQCTMSSGSSGSSVANPDPVFCSICDLSSRMASWLYYFLLYVFAFWCGMLSARKSVREALHANVGDVASGYC